MKKGSAGYKKRRCRSRGGEKAGGINYDPAALLKRRQSRPGMAGATARQRALISAVLIRGVFKAFAGLFDVLADTLGGVAGGEHDEEGEKRND